MKKSFLFNFLLFYQFLNNRIIEMLPLCIFLNANCQPKQTNQELFLPHQLPCQAVNRRLSIPAFVWKLDIISKHQKF